MARQKTALLGEISQVAVSKNRLQAIYTQLTERRSTQVELRHVAVHAAVIAVTALSHKAHVPSHKAHVPSYRHRQND